MKKLLLSLFLLVGCNDDKVIRFFDIKEWGKCEYACRGYSDPSSCSVRGSDYVQHIELKRWSWDDICVCNKGHRIRVNDISLPEDRVR